MKTPKLDRWIPLSETGEVLWLKYAFGPGTANALAVRLKDATWAVISPPRDAPTNIYDALDRDGGVSALVAPNSFHNLGQSAWRARFPRAVSYAAVGAMPRLAQKTPDVVYRPIEEFTQRLAPITWFLPDGMKTPDLLFCMPVAGEDIWWMGDQFSNSTKDDQIPILRLLARLVGSGPGYRVNSKPEMVYVEDRSAWLESIRAALRMRPPRIVVPAHGDPVTDNVAERTFRAMDAIDLRRGRRGWS